MIHQSVSVEAARIGRPSSGRRRLALARARVAFGFFASLSAPPLLGCGDPASELELASKPQPILGGSVDDEHPQVMLLADVEGFLCTSTLIEVAGDAGFLLTAAHCVVEEVDAELLPLPPERLVVVPGVDFAESTVALTVDAVHVEPGYAAGFAENDVAVVRFSFGGEPAPTPIRPLSSGDDRLDVDDGLLLIGYGQTETEEANTERRRVERSIEALDDELVAYSQEDGQGACFGDSGGPALVVLEGEERVAAVISGGVDGDDGCSGGFGVAMRASAFESFIADALLELP